MNQVSTVGLDLAKYIFQLHGLTVRARWSFARSCAAASFWRSWQRCRLHGGHGGLRQRALLGP